jgi:glutaconate CoA-transferase subunit A
MNACFLPHWVLSAVCAVPHGAHPSYAHGYYVRDNAFCKQWDAISRDREAFLAWMKQHVLGTKDHAEFMKSAGIAVPAKKVAHA